MGAETEQILDRAMRLSYEERFALAERLQESLHPPGEQLARDGWWESWAPEIRRRLAASDDGATPGVAADQVFGDLKARRDGRTTG